MPHSMEGLLIVAIVVPLVAVGVAYVLNWLGMLNERMRKRHNIILHIVMGGIYIVSGAVTVLAGVETWFPAYFLIMGTWWVVYGLWLRRTWRDHLDEPVGSDGLP
ncbi:MAG TPA: hypothetical protein ENK19_02865 [Acidobacteria bacterium]|nr:hypothetical protein [Acidobacteriota bacterium]